MPAEARYSCQIKLPGFGSAAQAKLKRASVLLVGAGGLGCPAAQYLTSAGIGKLTIVDFDIINIENLHRQILFTPADDAKSKAATSIKRQKRQNPAVQKSAKLERVTAPNAIEIIEPYDIVVDCTDNFEARYLLSDACVLAGKPLVYGAAYQYEGQVTVWNVLNDDGSRSPHYRDIFPEADSALSEDCASGGVNPALTGIIGCMEANETIKYLAGLPGLLAGRLLLFDVRTMQSSVIALPAVSTTPVRDFTTEMTMNVPTISVKALQTAMPEQEYQLIDVRSRDEHTDFNIGGQLMPLYEIIASTAGLKLEKPIVFYCATGRRSATAVRLVLHIDPAAKVLSLEGGVEAWRRQIKDEDVPTPRRPQKSPFSKSAQSV
jgi:adenylyltransferase/sulfurtransferase